MFKTDEELLLEGIQDILNDVKKVDPELLEDIVLSLNSETEEMLLDESVKDKVKKTVEKGKIVKRTVDHKIKKGGEHLDNLIDAARKSVMGESRDEIITNSTKVSTIIKRILTSGAIALISPAIGLVHLLVTTALRKKLKTREREKILADLKLELEICEEKINDANNDNDKKAKYELMRLRNNLKKNIIRVQNSAKGVKNIG